MCITSCMLPASTVLVQPMQVGKVPVGSEHPLARQTMTTTDTRDVEATVEQVRGSARVWACALEGGAGPWRGESTGTRVP